MHQSIWEQVAEDPEEVCLLLIAPNEEFRRGEIANSSRVEATIGRISRVDMCFSRQNLSNLLWTMAAERGLVSVVVIMVT